MSRSSLKEKYIRPAVDVAKDIAADAADSARSFFLKTFDGVRPANEDDLLYWGEKDYKGERLEQAVEREGITEDSVVEITFDSLGKRKLTGTVLRIGSNSITFRTLAPNQDTLTVMASEILRGRKDHKMRIRKIETLTKKQRDAALKAKDRFDAADERDERKAERKWVRAEKRSIRNAEIKKKRVARSKKLRARGTLGKALDNLIRTFTEEDWEYASRQMYGDDEQVEARLREMEAEAKYYAEKNRAA